MRADVAERRRPSRKWHWSIRAYLVVLVVIFAVVTAAATLFARARSASEARSSAASNAAYGARLASSSVSAGLALAEEQVAKLVQTPGLSSVFAAPRGCSLTFAGAGGFSAGHLDIVSSKGTVVCSSLPFRPSTTYRGASWLPVVQRGLYRSAPLVDPRSGQLSIVEGAPIPGGGAAVVFLSLDSLGPSLTAQFGGPQDLEFLVVSGTPKHVLARTISPNTWVGRSLAATPFAPGTSGSVGKGVDGVARLYGSAAVAGTDWTVYAGERDAEALAASTRVNRDELWLLLGGLVIVLLATGIAYHQIARPLSRLSLAARSSGNDLALSGFDAARGPAEVASLASAFRGYLAGEAEALMTASRLAAIVESAASAIIATDLTGAVTSWNHSAEQLFGYRADEAEGRQLSALFPTKHATTLTELAEMVRLGGRAPVHETTLADRAGNALAVSLNVSPIDDADGEVIGISIIIRDIHELKEQEAERRSLEERLEQSQRLESLGRLAGGVAHDFNNLLGVILNYAQFVEKKLDAAARTDAESWGRSRDDVGQIQLAVERAARLTSQLLAFARRDVTRPIPLDVNGVVHDVEELLRRTLGEDVVLRCALADDLAATVVDRGHLEQVLINLAVNARDAMVDGGTLTIETALVDIDEVFAEGRPNLEPGRFVSLRVSDTGMGMVPEVRERAFEPFFTTKPKGEGTGLGLATIHGIVNQAGGYVALYSEPGHGTTVSILLPASAGLAATEVSAENPRASGSGELVLVVEDEEALREVAQRILEENGYRVIAAENGPAALELIEGGAEPDLLVTDVVMPQMLGRELVARVHDRYPTLPVLYMSGYAKSVLDATGRIGDDVPIVTKPFSETTLLERIAAALHGESAR